MKYGVLKRGRLLKAVVFAMGALLLVTLPLEPALAADKSIATNGYRISPVRTDLTIKPGTGTTVTVYIQNASNAVEHLQVLVNDFQPPKDESGNPSLLLNNAAAPQHSLKQFATIPPNFTLQPNEQKAVAVTLKVPDGTAGGGYYGAIRFAPLGDPGSKNVNLSASIASLVLITVPGNINEQLSIAGFGVAQGKGNSLRKIFFSNKDLKAVVRFQNEGNVQVQPFGKIVLRNGSKSLGTFAINDSETPGNVLPDSIRLFSTKITKVGSFGKYKVQGNFGYGSKGLLLTSEATFYVIPVALIITVLLVILLIIFLVVVVPRLIRRHDRRVLERTNRQR